MGRRRRDLTPDEEAVIEKIRVRHSFRTVRREMNEEAGLVGPRTVRKKRIPSAVEDVATLLAIIERTLGE